MVFVMNKLALYYSDAFYIEQCNLSKTNLYELKRLLALKSKGSCIRNLREFILTG